LSNRNLISESKVFSRAKSGPIGFGYASRKGAKTPSPEFLSFRPQGEI
jgi:hypothetical protein